LLDFNVHQDREQVIKTAELLHEMGDTDKARALLDALVSPPVMVVASGLNPDRSPLASPTLEPMRMGRFFMPTIDNKYFLKNQINPLHLLATRLRIDAWKHRSDQEAVPDFPNIQHLDIYLDEVKAYVYYIQNSVPGTLEDDINLFPSEDLLARMRLLMK